MRLIDADSLRQYLIRKSEDKDCAPIAFQLKKFAQILDCEETIEAERGGRLRGVDYEDGKVSSVMIRDTDDEVKQFVPLKHGRWIFGVTCHHEWMKCSECLVSQTQTEVFSYCPNCGAKMDGE